MFSFSCSWSVFEFFRSERKRNSPESVGVKEQYEEQEVTKRGRTPFLDILKMVICLVFIITETNYFHLKPPRLLIDCSAQGNCNTTYSVPVQWAE